MQNELSTATKKTKTLSGGLTLKHVCLTVKTICDICVFQAITKDMFEEALRALADDDFLTVTGKTVRLL